MIQDKATIVQKKAIKYRLTDITQEALKRLIANTILGLPEAKKLGLILNPGLDKIRLRQSITGLGSPLKGRTPELISIVLDRTKVPTNKLPVGDSTWNTLKDLFNSLIANPILKSLSIYIKDDISWFNYSLDDANEPASLLLTFEYYPTSIEESDKQDVKDKQAFDEQKLSNIIDEKLRKK